VGDSVGVLLGNKLGVDDGDTEGKALGVKVGEFVSPTLVGEIVGDNVGVLLGNKLGVDDGDTEG
jgi:hypothetical protein